MLTEWLYTAMTLRMTMVLYACALPYWRQNLKMENGFLEHGSHLLQESCNRGEQPLETTTTTPHNKPLHTFVYQYKKKKKNSIWTLVTNVLQKILIWWNFKVFYWSILERSYFADVLKLCIHLSFIQAFYAEGSEEEWQECACIAVLFTLMGTMNTV